MKCESCKELFQVELNRDQSIIEVARNYPCPRCEKTPNHAAPNVELSDWHHIVGFHIPTKTAP